MLAAPVGCAESLWGSRLLPSALPMFLAEAVADCMIVERSYQMLDHAS